MVEKEKQRKLFEAKVHTLNLPHDLDLRKLSLEEIRNIIIYQSMVTAISHLLHGDVFNSIDDFAKLYPDKNQIAVFAGIQISQGGSSADAYFWGFTSQSYQEESPSESTLRIISAGRASYDRLSRLARGPVTKEVLGENYINLIIRVEALTQDTWTIARGGQILTSLNTHKTFSLQRK